MTSADGAAESHPRASAMAAIDTDYERQLTARRAARAAADRQHLLLSRIRLGLVAAIVILGVALGREAVVVDAVLAVAFIVAAVAHSRVLVRRTRLGRAVTHFERGLARLRHEWIGKGDRGDRYRHADHPYADDLDVFGVGSAFELLAVAQTQPGLDTLARWLTEAATPTEVAARQAAITELVPRADLREALAVEGDAASAHRLSTLREWAAAGTLLPASGRLALFVTSGVLVACAAFAGATQTMSQGLAAAILLTFAVQAALVVWLHERVRQVLRGTDGPVDQLALLAGLLRTIEQSSFTSDRLVAIQRALGGSSRPASAEIARLRQFVGLLDSRKNILFAPVAASIAWATQVAYAIDRWRGTIGPHVVRWIDAVGEFEALAAMATYAAEHPTHVWPTFADGSPAVRAVDLAHPLLPASAIGNDITMGAGDPHVFIVSGSNMSGKSTFLRAIGLNVVFAQAGLPVRATSFAMTPVAVGASIRIVDSLAEGRSKFFAEIGRLKLVVDVARARQGSLLFLLDEILAGTNSHDRLRGAEGVIAGLAAIGAIGLVTTHDLALGEVVGRLPVPAVNVHFADEFDQGGLHFDYRLRPGLVRTSNALELMRAVGLEI